MRVCPAVSAPFAMSCACVSSTLYRQIAMALPYSMDSHTQSGHSGWLPTPSSSVFDLVCSFPLLEDLGLVFFLGSQADTVQWIAPSTSPKLTGCLELSTRGGIHSAVRRLLNFPGGVRFAKITVSCLGSDFEPATDLVSGCSGTLESLQAIYSSITGPLSPASLIDRYLTAAR